MVDYTIRCSNDKRLTDVGTNEVVPILSASSASRCCCCFQNHSLFEIVTALVPWLIYSSSLHPTPLHTCRCSCIPTHATVDRIRERYRQIQSPLIFHPAANDGNTPYTGIGKSSALQQPLDLCSKCTPSIV